MKMAIGLTFPGTLQDESVICYLCKNYDITMNIIEASFSMASGWAFLEIEGDNDAVKKALDYINSKDIKIQQLKQTK